MPTGWRPNACSAAAGSPPWLGAGSPAGGVLGTATSRVHVPGTCLPRDRPGGSPRVSTATRGRGPAQHANGDLVPLGTPALHPQQPPHQLRVAVERGHRLREGNPPIGPADHLDPVTGADHALLQDPQISPGPPGTGEPLDPPIR